MSQITAAPRPASQVVRTTTEQKSFEEKQLIGLAFCKPERFSKHSKLK